VSRPEREDIVQEVAARVLASRVPFNSSDDLIGWALTTGHNLWTDDGRRWRRRGGSPLPLVECDVDGDAWEVPPANLDVATLVEGRLALHEVLDALRAMSAEDRDAILAGVTGRQANGRMEAVRVKVRRHRVRQRLKPVLDRATSVLEGVAAAAALGRRSVRSLTTRLTGWRVSYPAVEPILVTMTTVAAPLLVGMLGLSAEAVAIPSAAPARSTAMVPASGLAVAPTTSTTTTAESEHRRSPDNPAEPSGTTRRSAVILDGSVNSPTGHGIVDGRVSEEPGDEAIVCVGNVPLVREACISEAVIHP
jgi:hypothetical protein